MSSGKTAYC